MYYECGRCVNRHSPLCELCSYVTSPGGESHKPKYYVEYSGVIPKFKCGEARARHEDERTEECAKALEALLIAGEPLPVALVMEYNGRINT